MGLLARQQVEANYSVSAWAETFVTSMTGMSPAAARRFLEDRSSRADRTGAQGLSRTSPGRDHSELSTRSAIDEPVHSARTIDGLRALG